MRTFAFLTAAGKALKCLRFQRAGASHEGRHQGHRIPQQGPLQRADRDQPVLPARQDAEELGHQELAEHEYKESIDEMKHADMLADRILFLEGLPNFQALGKLRIGENPTEILQCDLSLERDAWSPCARPWRMPIRSATTSAASCSPKILDSEEEHIDWLETQLDLIERIGEPKYLLSKLEE
jgi:bacterioferritin